MLAESKRGTRQPQHVYRKTDLIIIESSGSVGRLDERSGMTNEQRVARGAGQHTDHCQPDVRDTLRRVSTETDTEHVRQRFEQRPRVLFPPVGMLSHVQHTLFASSESLSHFLLTDPTHPTAKYKIMTLIYSAPPLKIEITTILKNCFFLNL